MKSHRTDGVSLTFGLVFLVIAGWYLAARLVDLDLPMMGWSVAGGLILLGLLGLVGALRTSRANEATPDPAEDTPPVEGASHPAGERVADADRAPIAERLRTALDDGRVSFTEYNERLQLAYTAVTYEELDQALAGLGAAQSPDGSEDAQKP
jgi:hypothetical protein